MSSAFTTEAAAGGAVGYTIKEAVRNGVAAAFFQRCGKWLRRCHACVCESRTSCHAGLCRHVRDLYDDHRHLQLHSFAILLSGVLHSGAIGVNLVQAAFSANLAVLAITLSCS